ncbi:hypothetical protein PanWU01x14_317170 [Parasponia andersonii]|uniref:Transmembrane protein n=1 Tax=Parasponia andersonii TaxID=3476 RepID=A0A2P5AMP4_PARAD|nr:hypothetical protein PanWU01x14_317170 [Parasponia andersonii]
MAICDASSSISFQVGSSSAKDYWVTISFVLVFDWPRVLFLSRCFLRSSDLLASRIILSTPKLIFSYSLFLLVVQECTSLVPSSVYRIAHSFITMQDYCFLGLGVRGVNLESYPSILAYPLVASSLWMVVCLTWLAFSSRALGLLQAIIWADR